MSCVSVCELTRDRCGTAGARLSSIVLEGAWKLFARTALTTSKLFPSCAQVPQVPRRGSTGGSELLSLPATPTVRCMVTRLTLVSTIGYAPVYRWALEDMGEISCDREGLVPEEDYAWQLYVAGIKSEHSLGSCWHYASC